MVYKELNSTSVLENMRYCKPPLEDIRKCNHSKLENDPIEDENGDPICQCKKGDTGWWVRTGPILREKEYGLQSQSGVGHTPRWEKKEINRKFTLRIDQEILKKLKSKPGPKGRLAPRLPINRRKVGGPPRGNPHILRRASLLVLQEDVGDLVIMLDMAKQHKPSKKKSVTVHMPNLEIAVNTLVSEIEEKRNQEYRRDLFESGGLKGKTVEYLSGLKVPPHPLLSRGWAPTLCRLIEIRELFGDSLVEYQSKEKERGNEEEQDGDFYEQEVGSDAWSRGDSGSESTR
jgi:hypothetical protein